jgi:hypothetical protein
VGAQLLARPLQLGAGGLGVAVVELEVDHPPDAGLVDGEAELAQRALNGLALWIEDPGLGADEDRRLHPSTTSGSAR